MSDAFCEIFEDVAVGRNFPVPIANTFEAWDNATLGDEGPEDLIIADIPNNRITVGTNGKGTYRVSVATQFGASLPSMVISAIFLNGIPQSKLTMYREILTPNDVGSMSVIAFLDLDVGDVLTLAYKTDKMNNDLILFHINITISTVIRDIVPTE